MNSERAYYRLNFINVLLFTVLADTACENGDIMFNTFDLRFGLKDLKFGDELECEIRDTDINLFLSIYLSIY